MPGRHDNCCENINEIIRKRRTLFCSLFWILVFVGFGIRILKTYLAPPIQPSPSSWDYLMFAESWPITFCRSIAGKDGNPADKCRNIPTKNDEKPMWTVHGIWPSRQHSKSPQNCRIVPLNVSDLQPIQKELDMYWASGVKNRDSSSFWKHEWQKHGTCGMQIENLNTSLKYFSQGLEWHKAYNIGKTLADCNILPDDSKVYSYDQVVDCFKKHFDIIPILDCRYDKVLKKQLLNEIRLCISKNFVPLSCDIFTTQKSCKEDFLYVATVGPLV